MWHATLYFVGGILRPGLGSVRVPDCTVSSQKLGARSSIKLYAARLVHVACRHRIPEWDSSSASVVLIDVC